MGTSSNVGSVPAAIAVVGAGPSGLYAVKSILARTVATRVDVFDRLPTPFGLVRYGIAPDNQKMKRVERVLRPVFDAGRVRYFGSVTLGDSITRQDLLEHYDALIYATGAQGTRELSLPGRDLRGSFSAKRFVDWYNGLPGAPQCTFGLDVARRAAVIGGGNVALDVARMLLQSQASLSQTDVPKQVLDVFERNCIADVYIIARRGPTGCRFTPVELRRLAEIPDIDVVVDSKDLKLTRHDEELVASNQQLRTNITLMNEWARAPTKCHSKRVHLKFFQSPVRILGTDNVERVELQQNSISREGQILGSGVRNTLDVDLVFAAIGQWVTPLPGVSYDSTQAVIPNVAGHIGLDSVRDNGREYVVGWAKRGPSGVVGTNKNDSEETVQTMLADFARAPAVRSSTRGDIAELLNSRGVRYTNWDQWLRIDEYEVSEGVRQNRPRVKVPTLHEMLNIAG